MLPNSFLQYQSYSAIKTNKSTTKRKLQGKILDEHYARVFNKILKIQTEQLICTLYFYLRCVSGGYACGIMEARSQCLLFSSTVLLLVLVWLLGVSDLGYHMQPCCP